MKQVEPDSDRYILSNKGCYTSRIDDKIFAILEDKNDNPTPEEWVIVEVPQHGPNKYMCVFISNQLLFFV